VRAQSTGMPQRAIRRLIPPALDVGGARAKPEGRLPFDISKRSTPIGHKMRKKRRDGEVCLILGPSG